LCEIVAHLREQGHSLRAIAGAVGVDHKTVRNDLSIADMSAMPDTIRTTDGRTYPATRPAISSVSAGIELDQCINTHCWDDVHRFSKLLAGAANTGLSKESGGRCIPIHCCLPGLPNFRFCSVGFGGRPTGIMHLSCINISV